MTIRSGVQYPQYLTFDLDVDTDGYTLKLPPNSLTVDGGEITVVTAAGGTSPTMTIVDNASSPNTFLSAGSLAAGKLTIATAGVGNFYAAGATLTITFGGTTPSGGRIVGAIPYVTVGRTNEKPYD